MGMDSFDSPVTPGYGLVRDGTSTTQYYHYDYEYEYDCSQTITVSVTYQYHYQYHKKFKTQDWQWKWYLPIGMLFNILVLLFTNLVLESETE